MPSAALLLRWFSSTLIVAGCYTLSPDWRGVLASILLGFGIVLSIEKRVP